MPFVSSNYASIPAAPIGKWVCAPSSSIAASSTVPTNNTQAPDYCGQCVSYVKHACPALPPTSQWKKGELVKGNSAIVAGTAIATFNASGVYLGHAAIYVSQDDKAINVYDQYVTSPPKAIGPRPIRFDGAGVNDGDNYYIIEPI